MFINERDYAKVMTRIAEPYLKSRRVSGKIERKEGKELYCDFYSSEDPRGVLILSHGFSESVEKYYEMIYYFLQNGYHVFAADHCGHGRSYRLTSDPCMIHVDNYQRYVADLLFIAEAAKNEYPKLPLYLYAHSMGGGIGACALSKRPDLFRKAVLSSPMICPKTGSVPWPVTVAIVNITNLIGKSKDYVFGQKPFEDNETFEDSAATSEARFEYYSKKRSQTPEYQTSGASFGWMKQAIRMRGYLLGDGWISIETPTLLFQAENDDFVRNDAQSSFADKINDISPGLIEVIPVPGAKHEIYNSSDATLKEYLTQIIKFFK